MGSMRKFAMEFASHDVMFCIIIYYIYTYTQYISTVYTITVLFVFWFVFVFLAGCRWHKQSGPYRSAEAGRSARFRWGSTVPMTRPKPAERLVTRWFEALQGSLPSLVVFHIKALVAIPCCIFSGCSVLQHSTFLLVLTMWALLTASALTAALAACEDGNCDVSNLLQKHRHQSMGAESKAKAATSVALEASSSAILEASNVSQGCTGTLIPLGLWEMYIRILG